MAKLRVYQLASQYDIPSREFVQILNRFEIPVKNHMSALTDQQVENFKNQFDPEKDRRAEEQAPAKKKKAPSKKSPAAKEEAKTASQKSKQTPKQKTKQAHADHSENTQGAEKKRAEKKKTADTKHKSAKPKQSEPRSQASEPKKKNGAEAPSKQNGGNKKNRKKKNKKERANRQGDQALKVKDHSKKGKTSHAVYKKKKDEKKSEQAKNRVYAIPENITVGELAETLDVPATEIIKILMLAGTMATINQSIDFDTAQLVCDELGYEVEAVKVEDVFEKMIEEYDEEETGNEETRPPVVTVMGHVDHGKTSLLDRIRQSHVTAGEAGGITQHIGAYTVKIQGKSITFIDTPGHAAFTAMRSRGAQMTDIAVLVVAADDGVMPQTIEAINHAKAAKVPIIVAINKIDKEGANPERVKQELVDQGVIVEEWGGDVIAVPVSAKKGENIDELLENILLVAEMEELTADPDRPARGCVIEARVKKGKGSTASILVQQGTLHLGDAILSGTTYGRVRTMVDDKGRRIKKAGPSKPVEVSGLSGTPEAGDDFIVMPSDKEARQMAEQRLEQEKNNRQAKAKVSLDDLFSRIQEGDVKDINLIVKADVQGSVEALTQSLQKLSNDEVKVNVIHGAVGAVNESDVLLATTSDAIIIGFNVRPDKNALAAAENEKIDIHLYRVIYDAIDDVKKAMEGLLDPEFVEKVTGDAEVRSTFRIPGGVIIAGAYVTDGKIGRSDEVRVTRDGIVVFEGKIASLRRFKDDVKEVNQGYECGIGIENYNDIKEGDVIETFVNEAVKREL